MTQKTFKVTISEPDQESIYIFFGKSEQEVRSKVMERFPDAWGISVFELKTDGDYIYLADYVY